MILKPAMTDLRLRHHKHEASELSEDVPKGICEVLPRTERCPKCSSTKYKVEHLLPNLSLRHAIEHFLESQTLTTAPESDLQKYVPDGKSCIQGKDIYTATKRKLDMLYSTSATDKGSNHNIEDSVYESQKRKILDQTGYHADSQGENQPVMPQVCMPDEDVRFHLH